MAARPPKGWARGTGDRDPGRQPEAPGPSEGTKVPRGIGHRGRGGGIKPAEAAARASCSTMPQHQLSERSSACVRVPGSEPGGPWFESTRSDQNQKSRDRGEGGTYFAVNGVSPVIPGRVMGRGGERRYFAHNGRASRPVPDPSTRAVVKTPAPSVERQSNLEVADSNSAIAARRCSSENAGVAAVPRPRGRRLNTEIGWW